MRRRPNEPAVFGGEISREEKTILDNLLPMQGGRKWMIETALAEFCTLCEANKTLQAWVHDRVLEARAQEPPRGTDPIQPRVSPALYDRFNKMFGEKGATSWFLRKLVTAYIDIYSQKPLPEDTVKEAVRKVLELEA